MTRLGKHQSPITISSVKSIRPPVSLLPVKVRLVTSTSRESSFHGRPPAVALIGNIPITGLSTRNNSAICGAILSGHIGRAAVSYFHPEFSFSSRSGQHDERRDLLHYTGPVLSSWPVEAKNGSCGPTIFFENEGPN